MTPYEPDSLAEVRPAKAVVNMHSSEPKARYAPLTRRLEEKPLELEHLLFKARDRNLVLGVVPLNKVLHNRIRLPGH